MHVLVSDLENCLIKHTHQTIIGEIVEAGRDDHVVSIRNKFQLFKEIFKT